MDYPDFLPVSAASIQDLEAIALLQSLQRQVIRVALEQGEVAIATAYVHQSPAAAVGQTNSTPILLLHGFDSSLLEFRRLFPLLSRHRDTWAIDLVGSGFTQHLPTLAVNPHTIRQHLLGVLGWIGQPVTLVGASLGGAVAIDLALHYPDWVRSLVLIDSVGFSGSFPLGQFLPTPLIELGAEWLRWRKWAALTVAAHLPISPATLIDAVRCSLVHQEMPGWKQALTSFTQSGGYSGLGEAAIAQIRHPTLILWGAADDVLGTDDAARFQRAIAGSQLAWIPQAGHVPHLDQPPRVATHLLNNPAMNPI